MARRAEAVARGAEAVARRAVRGTVGRRAARWLICPCFPGGCPMGGGGSSRIIHGGRCANEGTRRLALSQAPLPGCLIRVRYTLKLRVCPNVGGRRVACVGAARVCADVCVCVCVCVRACVRVRVCVCLRAVEPGHGRGVREEFYHPLAQHWARTGAHWH